MRTVVAIVGVALVLMSWLSVSRTVFTPRRRSSLVARLTARLTARVVFGTARKLSSFDGVRERLLALCSPVTLFEMAVIWLGASLAGFALLAWGSAGVALSVHGLVGLFLLRPAVDGSGAAVSQPASPAAVIAAVAWLSAVLMLAAFVTHLVRVTDAYGRRERPCIRLAAQATCPPDAESLIVDYLRGGSRDHLGMMFGDWAGWLADTQATHLGYPVLAYYRSIDLCWTKAALIILDCAALTQACAPEWAPPDTVPLLSAGSKSLQGIAAQLGISLPRIPVSYHGREEYPFNGTIGKVRKAGLPMETDEDSAQAEFQRLRVQYAPFANAIVEHLLCDLEPC
jgi:hypothetical protein